MVRHTAVVLPYSKLKHRIADILLSEGRLAAVDQDENNGRPVLKLQLRYLNNQPVIRSLKRISTPGRRVYVGAGHLPFVFDGLGFAIVSTSKGLMTNKQARRANMGGEVLCEIF